ncbi:hypothetical protein BJ165DRAFT_1400479 [Panaeolus papilionaceus]|nr:hypothetical protein BJ165DRAFT_1400479 [Panaeolus papilionaceus]
MATKIPSTSEPLDVGAYSEEGSRAEKVPTSGLGGLISCAECRRRGCADTCPEGLMQPFYLKGRRDLKDKTYRLSTEINELKARINQLEAELEISHKPTALYMTRLYYLKLNAKTGSVTRDDFFSTIFDPIYNHHANSASLERIYPHRLAIFYATLALGGGISHHRLLLVEDVETGISEEAWMLLSMLTCLVFQRTEQEREAAQRIFWEIVTWEAWAVDTCAAYLARPLKRSHASGVPCAQLCSKSPAYDGGDFPWAASLDEGVQQYMIVVIMNLSLVFLHQIFLTEALRLNPDDPYSTPYRYSVGAVMRCSARILRGLSSMYFTYTCQMAKLSSTISTSMLLGCNALANLAMRNPRSSVVPPAMWFLNSAIGLYETVARHNDADSPSNLLLLREKVLNVITASIHQPQPHSILPHGNLHDPATWTNFSALRRLDAVVDSLDVQVEASDGTGSPYEFSTWMDMINHEWGWSNFNVENNASKEPMGGALIRVPDQSHTEQSFFSNDR